MNSDTFAIELPLPDRKLSPNARVHWRAKSKAVKFAKELSFYKARSEGVLSQKWEKANWEAVFYFRTNRKRDIDNLIASLKSAVDGIVKAGLLVDDCGLSAPKVIVNVDTNANERVILFFTKAV